MGADQSATGLTDREEMETALIRALIGSYFSIVRQTIQDLVPKAIMREFTKCPGGSRCISVRAKL